MGYDRGLIQEDLNICLIVFSTVFVVLRTYVRGFMVKTFRLDDVLAIMAWGVLITQSSLEIKEVKHGAGKQIQDVDPADLMIFFSILPTMQLLYFAGTGLVRLSIVAFLPRLSTDKNWMRIVYALGFTVITMSVTCFFILLFECKHVPDLWNKANPTRQCLSSRQETLMFWIHAALGIFIDLILLALPIWIIRSKMMFSATSIRVMVVFSVGIFVLVTGIVRFAIIVNSNLAINTTYVLPIISIWTDLEGHIGLWVACFPTLQPLLRIAAHKLGLSTSGRGKKTTGNTGPQHLTSKFRSSSYAQNFARSQAKKSGSTILTDGPDDTESQKGIVMLNEREVGLELGEIPRGPSPEGGITKTTEIVFSSEQASFKNHGQHNWNAM